MIDIRILRENPELVKKSAEAKGYPVDIDRTLDLDTRRRQLQQRSDDLRARRNDVAAQMRDGKPEPTLIDEGKKIKQELVTLEKDLSLTEEEFYHLFKQIPNLPTEDVPIGASEAENVKVREWGEKPQFDFKPKTHWEIAEARGWIDKERAAKVTGARFAYLKGDLVKLQLALIQFVMDNLTTKEKLEEIISDAKLEVSAKPFIPVLPPAMIREEVFEAMDRLDPRDDRYKVGEDKDGLWLQGSAEHTLGPMHMGETFKWTDLPVRYLGYATSFRREAGTYGKDTEGIIRMHQFDKLEMESFTTYKFGLQEHLFLVAIQEYLMQQLKLPYQVLQKCTADIGKPNARGVDIEVWLPGRGNYLETHTADYMTDYQTRRLDIKVSPEPQSGVPAVEFNTKNPPTTLAYTNDATAFAPGRTMVGIIENYQQSDGDVIIPEVLRPYLGNREVL